MDDVIIIGAGASGLMCAIEAGKRGRNVRVVDHANKAGKKILMSGGGRCNFTNYTIEPENYISQNPHFCKSALSRYSQWDFLAMVERYQIPYHERSHGQLFCDRSAKDILNMLLAECQKYKVKIQLNCSVDRLEQTVNGFSLTTSAGELSTESLVIASGGLSIPKMGATPFGYKIAEQFSMNIIPTKAGLVPLTWQDVDKKQFAGLSGIAIPASVTYKDLSFTENILFTHRGLSGPAILQISSYWQPGETLLINLIPEINLIDWLKNKRQQSLKNNLGTLLAELLPKKLVKVLVCQSLLQQPVSNCADQQIEAVARQLQQWTVKPNATEGYRTAEVTVGGVDCNEISSKTMASKSVPGLYFIGEVLDVTGWLGGYNFQWAWSSGWCAGQFV